MSLESPKALTEILCLISFILFISLGEEDLSWNKLEAESLELAYMEGDLKIRIVYILVSKFYKL